MDFVSFDPLVKSRHQLFIKRLERDNGKIEEMEAGVIRLLREVDEMIARLDGLNPLTEQLRESLAQDSELGITDADIEWIKEVQNAAK